MLGMIAGLSVVGAAGLNLASPGSPAYADSAPSSGAAAAAWAVQQVNKTLATLQSTVMTVKPWSTYKGDWCAVFASFAARSATGFRSSSLDLYTYGATPVSSPAVGDIIYYPSHGHTGMVYAVSGGIASTVEGNTPTAGAWSTNYVKKYAQPWTTGYEFSRPQYSGGTTPPVPTEGDPGLFIVHVTDGSNAGFWAINPSAPRNTALQFDGRAVPITQTPASAFDGTPAANSDLTGANFTYVMTVVNSFG